MKRPAPVLSAAVLPLALATFAFGCADHRTPITGLISTPLGEPVPAGKRPLLIVSMSPPLPEDAGWRVRINGQYVIIDVGDGDWAYSELHGAGSGLGTSLLPGPYTVELVDHAGTVVGSFGPFDLAPGPEGALGQAHAMYPQLVSWGAPGSLTWRLVDPVAQDADPTTLEMTVVNALSEPAAVDRCHYDSNGATCVPISTLAPGAETHLVETMTSYPVDGDPALAEGAGIRFHPANAPTPYSEKSLDLRPALVSCQVGLFVILGQQSVPSSDGISNGLTSFVGDTCRLLGP
jgi:hypothetical protein